MIYRPLGDTDLSVSVLGLGTVKFGRNQGLKLAPFALPDDRTIVTLLETARAIGINLLDTAPAYGDAEERLTQLLPGRREDWIICTKVGETFADGQSTYNFTAAAIEASVKRSARRLGYLDVVLLHSNGTCPSAALDTLLQLKSSGVVRAVGISHASPAEGRRFLSRSDVLMATLNETNRSETTLIERAGREKRGVVIKKPLASGHAAAASLRAIASHPGVSSVVVGTVSREHLLANAAALDGIS